MINDWGPIICIKIVCFVSAFCLHSNIFFHFSSSSFFQDHVIVAVFAEPDSPLIGLRNLIMPIRASNIHYNDLLHVVIIGDADYLKSKFIQCLGLHGIFAGRNELKCGKKMPFWRDKGNGHLLKHFQKCEGGRGAG